MKLIIIPKYILSICMLTLTISHAQAKLTSNLDQQIDNILAKLHEAQTLENYTTSQFIANMKNLAVEFNQDKKNKLDHTVNPLKQEIILLSRELQNPKKYRTN